MAGQFSTPGPDIVHHRARGDFGFRPTGRKVGKMTTYKRIAEKAVCLVKKLQSDITTGKKQICENYGQKTIRRFMDNVLEKSDLTYQEKCEIKDILYKVSSIV